MKHVSIQTDIELKENLEMYQSAHTNGREPDKDWIFQGNIDRIQAEIQNRKSAYHTKERYPRGWHPDKDY